MNCTSVRRPRGARGDGIRRMADDQAKAIDSAIQQIERKFGTGSVMRMGAMQANEVPAVSTGSLALDVGPGRGRPAPWPRG